MLLVVACMTALAFRSEPCSPITSPWQQLGYLPPYKAVCAMSDVLTLHEFSDDLAVHFRDINAEWIHAMFRK